MPHNQTPAYNLKVVLKETGIAADTLRAWERRYGLPMPKRSGGGHRLYSQRDIETIKWLTARQADGLTISRAVGMYNDMLASGTDPLAESSASAGLTPQDLSARPANLDALRGKWLDACRAYDEAGAEQICNQAFALYSVETVVLDLLQRGLHEMGEMWYRGEASVQQEHFASGLAMRRLEALIAASPAPTRKETILLACPPDEWHTFPLVMLNLILRRRGWNTAFLGANTPLERVEETAKAIQPALIVTAAQQLVTAATLKELAALLAKRDHVVAFGGRAFNRVPELRKVISGEFLGEGLETAEARIEILVEEPVSITKRRTSAGARSAQAYREARPFIEMDLNQRLKKSRIFPEHLRAANHYFGDALAAALELGSASYLAADMDWIRNLLAQHEIPGDALQGYLAAYSYAAQKAMGDESLPLVEWLKTQIVQSERK